MKRTTWTFEPSPEAISLVKKAVNKLARRAGPKRKSTEKRGLRTAILNEAIRSYLEKLQGKRETPSAEKKRAGAVIVGGITLAGHQ